MAGGGKKLRALFSSACEEKNIHPAAGHCSFLSELLFDSCLFFSFIFFCLVFLGFVLHFFPVCDMCKMVVLLIFFW